MASFPAGYTMVPDGVGGMAMQPLYSYGQQVANMQMQNGYNPINQQMAQNMGQGCMQSPQQMLQQPMVQTVIPQGGQMVLPGKMVESVDSVRVTDIPMDNKTYCFPKGDWSEIYTKRWKDDGNSEIVTYSRNPEAPTEQTKDMLNSMFISKEEFQQIQQMQVSLEQKMNVVMETVSRLEQAFK